MTTQSTAGIAFHNLTGTIEVASGLLIGGPEAGLEAGGIDKTFIRNPADGMPYVPGSSLKGKVRSLLERRSNKVPPTGRPHSCTEVTCEICLLFGAGDVHDRPPGRGPSRLLFRDAPFAEESRKALSDAIERGDRYFEVKTETAMNRNSGTVADGTLHTFERVPQGAKFDLLITLRALAGDNVAALKAEVERGLKALENDYLGGSGSRGYGKVKIHIKGWEQAAL
ncbi:MAG: type III-A CRISPR-associated RAMP protein Csm3 [Chloroflexota bacterium]